MYKFLAQRIKDGYLTWEQIPERYIEEVKAEFKKLASSSTSETSTASSTSWMDY